MNDVAAQPIVIVTGVPRSGTSLLMQMLAAGGMPVLTDGRRPADASNPRGYFEYEPVKRTARDPSWLADAHGKAVKMIYVHLPDLPPIHHYRVILLDRPMLDVVASQRAMLRSMKREGSTLNDAYLADALDRDYTRVKQWLRQQSNMTTFSVQYVRILSQPRMVAEEIAAFSGSALNLSAMAAVVDPALNHHP